MSLPEKKNESLFQLVQMSHEIQQRLAESYGEMTPDIEKALTEIQEKMPSKADGYKFIIDDLKAQAEVWNQRADNLALIAQAFTKFSEKLKYSLKMACIQLGVDELEGTDYKWNLINSPPSVIIDDEGKIPSVHKEIIQKTVIRKDSILAALKDGNTVPGAHLEQGSYVKPFPNTGKKKKGS